LFARTPVSGVASVSAILAVYALEGKKEVN